MQVFGPNVYVFAPTDSPAEIQSICTNLFNQQEAAQFGTERYAVFFKPGTYSTDIKVKVGFYTQVAGLGQLPDETNMNSMTVDANWMACRPWQRSRLD